MRKDLLSGIPALWGLIEDHDLRCSHVTVRKLLDSKSGDAAAKKTVQEMVEYDRSIRVLVVEKAGDRSGHARLYVWEAAVGSHPRTLLTH